jgi:hypothetical protein
MLVHHKKKFRDPKNRLSHGPERKKELSGTKIGPKDGLWHGPEGEKSYLVQK